VQENVLDRYPDANVRVFAVWLPIIPTDQRFQVADLMVDDRATHYWDGGQIVGEYFAARDGAGGVAWDVFYVFGPEAAWGDEPRATGAPVVTEGSRLEAALRPYLE
jgi:hypothetical protein